MGEARKAGRSLRNGGSRIKRSAAQQHEPLPRAAHHVDDPAHPVIIMADTID